MRLKHLKSEKMGDLIRDVRAKMVQAWDEVRFTQPQRKLFAAAFITDIDDAGEDLLQLHEDELKRLEQLVAATAPLFKLIQKREQLRKELAVCYF